MTDHSPTIQGAGFPPLPATPFSRNSGNFAPLYTADHMRAYVLADRASREAGQEAVPWVNFDPGFHDSTLAPEASAAPSAPALPVSEASPDSAAFKNFHRSLCARFGYTHDERDWRRDQVSLLEFLAAKLQAPTVAWVYEHDGCKDEPILTMHRWPDCREPWNETPLDALALAKHAIEKVWLDAVGTGHGEHSISEVARKRIEFAADALRLASRLRNTATIPADSEPAPSEASPDVAKMVAHATTAAHNLARQHLSTDLGKLINLINDLGAAATQAKAAAPALAREPLTEEQLEQAQEEWSKADPDAPESSLFGFARIVERAHGITADSARAAASEPLSVSGREVKP